MRNPKFSVGEIVRVDSFDHPHRNGIFTVLEVKDGLGFDRVGNAYVVTIHYKLDDFGNEFWAESALRKIDGPSDGFDRFLDKSLGKPAILDQPPATVPLPGHYWDSTDD